MSASSVIRWATMSTHNRTHPFERGARAVNAELWTVQRVLHFVVVIASNERSCAEN